MALEWLEKKFLYYTEVQLATTDRVFMRTRSSKYERERQRSVSDEMVKVCRQIIGTGAAKWDEVRRMTVPRLIEQLRRSDNGGCSGAK